MQRIWQMRLIDQTRFHRWLLCGLLVCNWLLSLACLNRQPIAWDAVGYEVAGQNIARGIGPVIMHPLNAQLGPYFTLAAFATPQSDDPARLYLNYPPGFPILLAIPQWLGLPDFVVVPTLSTLSLLFTYLLGSQLFDHWAGVLGATFVALTPTHLEWGASFYADLPGTCFIVGTLTIYLLAVRRANRVSRIALGSLAGAMASEAILIKYSNALVLLPLLAYVIYSQRRSMFRSSVNWSLAVTVAVGMIGVGLYNQAAYGSPLETFYSSARNGYSFPMFSLSYAVGPSPGGGYGLQGAARTVWDNFGWLLAPAVLGWAVSPRATKILLGAGLLVFLGLSSTFAWPPQNEDARYLLPLFAPIGLCAARGCLWLIDRWPARRVAGRALLVFALGLTTAISLSGVLPRLMDRNRGEQEVAAMIRSAVRDSEPNAIFLVYAWNDVINLFGDRTTIFYRRLSQHGAALEDQLTNVVTGLLQAQRPVYYVVDRQPPLFDSLAILRRHYDLKVWKESPAPIYRVMLRP